jgi:hypothetical protein
MTQTTLESHKGTLSVREPDVEVSGRERGTIRGILAVSSLCSRNANHASKGEVTQLV